MSENAKCFPHIMVNETTVRPEEPWTDAGPRSRTPAHSEHRLEVSLLLYFAPRCLHPTSSKGPGSFPSPLVLSHPLAIKGVNLSKDRD